MIPSTRDPRFGPTPLPSRFQEFRENQWEAIEEVNERFLSGDRVVFLEAPTGSGKSLIGEVSRRLLHTNGIYCCTTKHLQDQFAESFPYGRILKGRDNYLTELGNVNEYGNPWDRPYSAITCADCTYNPKDDACSWCQFTAACPYRVARRQAEDSPLAIFNAAFLLTDSKFSGRFKDRGLVILDEGDITEDEILRQVEVEVSSARMQKLGMSPPRYKTKPSSWQEWIYNIALPNISLYLDGLRKPWEGAGPKKIREYKGYANLYRDLRHVKNEIGLGKWVYDGTSNQVIFRPVRVDKWGKELLWGYGQRFLLMSATILSADLMADELGLDLSYSFVLMKSTFPAKNRPVYVVPIADMTFKNRDVAWPQMATAIKAVLDRHPDERVLIHTVSYKLAQYLHGKIQSEVNRPLITYDSSKGKDSALSEYKRRARSVLIAASMDRGVDLPDEYCRVQVVAKVPFPNIKDKRIEGRLYSPGGTNWYRMRAIRTLIQMTGRGMRHKDDHVTTYILDKQFTDNLWEHDYLFADWWKEAIVWSLLPQHLLRGASR